MIATEPKVHMDDDIVLQQEIWYWSDTMTIVKIVSAIYYREGKVFTFFLSFPDRQLT